MKKVISLFLSLIMLLSAMGGGLSSYAADKKFAQDVLVQLQKKTGYVPGKTSVITGNCYAFVSAVCEQLYGTTYYYEQQDGNYKVKHATGNYYTVATHLTDKINALDTKNAEKIRDFFIQHAVPGDIVHYGSLNNSISSKHTFMIQSIDTEKLRIYHSNYAIANYPSSACHIDTIYWDSFVKSPTSTIYNSDRTIYSLNSLFNNKMRNGGVGITINRYKNYEKLFYMVKSTVPTLTISRAGTTSIKMEWNELAGAKQYQVQYKKSNADSFITATSYCTDTSYTLKNLELGTKYNFRVRAYIGNKWFDYCDPKSLKVLPPRVSSITFTATTTGLKLKWPKRTDIDGVRIYRSTTKDGDYTRLKTIRDTSVNTYIDTKVKYGTPYYYKVTRFKASGDNEYTSPEYAIKGTYKLKAPKLSIERRSATSVDLTIKPDGAQTEFVFSIKQSDGKYYIAKSTTKDTFIPLNGLELGMTYTVTFAEKNKFGTSDESKLVFDAVPKEITDVKAEVKTKGVKVSWNKETDVDGYKVYRSTAKDGTYTLVGTAAKKETGTFTDSTIKYGRDYYYIVRGYINNSAGEPVVGDASEVVGPLKFTLGVPEIKVTSDTATSLKISWSKVSMAQSYDLRYKQYGGKWQTIKGLTSRTQIISKLNTDKKYYFKVRASNAIGNGKYCAHKRKLLKVPTPEAPVLTNVSGGVKISYTPASYASGYEIYRADYEGGKYTLVGTVKGKKKKSYTDKTVKKYRVYYYKIRCYVTKDGVKHNSYRSAESKITYY